MWAKIDDGSLVACPYGPSELKRDNPNTSFPNPFPDEALLDWGIVPVVPVNPPAHDSISQNCVRTDPTLNDGKWFETWVVTDASPEEVAERKAQARAEAEAARRAAYVVEADPIFFMAQRGEATMDEWTAKVAEIKARYPYPDNA